jgi:isovaleryl-CoA dehydrogenase
MKLSPDHELIRDSVRRLAEAELAPIAARIDAEDWFPRDFFQRLGEIGALGVLVPEEYGGSGGDYIGATLIMEELARFSGSVSLSYGAHAVLCVGAIARLLARAEGSRAAAVCSGEAIGAWALAGRAPAPTRSACAPARRRATTT